MRTDFELINLIPIVRGTLQSSQNIPHFIEDRSSAQSDQNGSPTLGDNDFLHIKQFMFVF